MDFCPNGRHHLYHEVTVAGDVFFDDQTLGVVAVDIRSSMVSGRWVLSCNVIDFPCKVSSPLNVTILLFASPPT